MSVTRRELWSSLRLYGDPTVAGAIEPRQRAPSRQREVPSEYQEQCAVIRWFDSYAPTQKLDARLLAMVPNGMYLGDDQKARMIRVSMAKRAGLRPGVPDLVLFVARRGSHGLCVEMKRSDAGEASSEQKAYHDLLLGQGFRVCVAHGADAAISTIKDYLGDRDS